MYMLLAWKKQEHFEANMGDSITQWTAGVDGVMLSEETHHPHIASYSKERDLRRVRKITSRLIRS